MTSHEATLQHLGLLADKVARLETLRVEAELQFVYRLAADFRAGAIGPREIHELYQRFRECGTRGFGQRWNAAMPYELHTHRIRWTANRYLPDSDGVWRGEYPFTDATHTPWPGASVVYVLFDECNEPVYTGSTQRFRTRMHSHRRDGKQFVRWVACPCPDRESAYDLEEQLLREHKPHLNHRVGR